MKNIKTGLQIRIAKMCCSVNTFKNKLDCSVKYNGEILKSSAFPFSVFSFSLSFFHVAISRFYKR